MAVEEVVQTIERLAGALEDLGVAGCVRRRRRTSRRYAA